MIQTANATVHLGSNLDILPTLPDNSVDSIVTDPPYELGFMGKSWDSSGIAYSTELWTECLRVLKPGGHLLAFGGSRTFHRIAAAIEDSGFQIRDSIAWMYGSGFPKSLDVSKAIDKAAGAEREKVQHKARPITSGTMSGSSDTRPWIEKSRETGFHEADGPDAATPEAQQWQGWGTALKPAFEPVIVARKPLIGTVAENVLAHGTGALNIDGSRIGFTSEQDIANYDFNNNGLGRLKKEEGDSLGLHQGGWKVQKEQRQTPQGRWPANVILDEYTAGLLDEQSGIRPGGTFPAKRGQAVNTAFASGQETGWGQRSMGDSGGASRFFYVAKASKRDRNEGLEGIEPQRHSDRENAEGVGGNNPRNRTNEARQNFHPTVKPTDLMRYLVKLVTPPNGTVLDPFTGSGSTGKAAILEGFRFIGIELTEDYFPIIEGRLNHAEQTILTAAEEKKEELF